MTKYTPAQLEQIKNTIIDSNIRRLTDAETHARLCNELGIDISIATIKNHKLQIKSQAQNWIAKLAKSKRGAYIACYRERIFEIEAVQKRLWDIMDSQQTGPRTKVEAAGKLLNCTGALVDLYDCMPLINAIREYDHDHDHHHNDDAQSAASGSPRFS